MTLPLRSALRSLPAFALVAAAALLAMPHAVAAQGIDTGALEITVLDPDGAPAAGVTVLVEGPQNERRLTTDADGVARFRGLVPGLYTARAESGDLHTDVREGLVVTTGRRTQAELPLRLAGVETTLEVRGARPLLDRVSGTVGATIGSELVERTPSGSGLFNSILDKVPGIVLSGVDVGGANASQQQGFSAHGAARGQNELNVNGSPTADASDGGAGMFYPAAAFAEVEVSTAAHAIEHQTPGVIVNMVSKSGTNRWRGGARFYYSNESLAGDNVSEELLAQGLTQGNPNTLLSDVDLQVGGPVVRDRLWAFVDYSRFDERRRILGIQGDLDERNLRNLTVNLDAQLADDHRLSARYFRGSKFRLNLGADRDWPVESSWLQDPSDTHIGQVNWLATWSDRTFADVRASYRDTVFGFVGRRPDSAAPHPEYPVGIPLSYDFFTGQLWGAPWESRQFQRDYGASAHVNHVVPGAERSHDLELGGQWREFRLSRVEVDPQGTYQWFAGGSPYSVELTTAPASGIEQLSASDGASDATRHLALYAQDSVRLGRRWSVTAALRFDHSTLWIPAQTRPASWWAGKLGDDEFGAAFRTASFPEQQLMTWRDLVPRLSMTYDTSGVGSTLLRGSYAQYSLRLNSDIASLVNPLRSGFNEYMWNDASGDGVFQWGEHGDLLFARHPSSTTALDPDLGSARTHELTAALEHQAGRDLVLGATFIYRTTSNAIEDINIGVPYGAIADRLGVPSSYEPVQTIDPGPDGVLGTPDDGGPITVWSQDPATRGQNFFLVTNTGRWGLDAPFSYRGLELTARKRFGQRWQMLASWTIGRTVSGLSGRSGISTGPAFDNPNVDVNRRGRAFDDRPHLVKLNASYLLPDPTGVSVGVSLRYESGPPTRRNFRIPRNLVTPGTPAGVLAAPLGEDDNPASLGRRFPSIAILDLRVEKLVELPDGLGQLSISAEGFNLLNENAARSVSQFSSAGYGRISQIVPPRMLRLGIGWTR